MSCKLLEGFMYCISVNWLYNAPMAKYCPDDIYIKELFSWKRAKCQVPLALGRMVTLVAVMRPGSPSSASVRRIRMRNHNHCLLLKWFHLKWGPLRSAQTPSAPPLWTGVKSLHSKACVKASEPTKDTDYIWTFLLL